MRLAWIICLLGACKFTPPELGDDGGVIDTPDGDPPPVREIVPSNHEDTAPLDAPDLPDLIMDKVDPDGDTTVWRIYTDTGLIQHEIIGEDVFGIYRNPIIGHDPMSKLQFFHVTAGDASYAVLYVRRFEVLANVSFEGYGDRPLILIARDQIRVVGEIDFSGGFANPGIKSADTTRGGPGGGNGGLNDLAGDPVSQGCGRLAVGGGASAGIAAPGDASGGGGGGGGSEGGDGGDKSASDTGGVRGLVCLTAELVPLRGGGGGGAADTAGGGGDGGGGGGAIQLTSFVAITIDGVIDAGGKGGFAQQMNDEGGGGGGAGGGILLEAPIVAINANSVLAANGGGGGSGRTAGEHGEQGTLTGQRAPGGLGSGGGNNDGRGGDGAAAEGAATEGNSHDPGGGGGGGGAGVVRLNADTGMLTLSPSAIVSPAHTQGQVVFVRSP